MSRGRRGRRRGGSGGPRPQGDAAQPAQQRPPQPPQARPPQQARPQPPIDDGPIPELPPEPPLLPRDPDGEDVFLGEEEGPPPPGQLVNLVGARFREAGRMFEFDAGDLRLDRGDRVVVETDAGLALATIAIASGRRMMQGYGLRRVVRRPDANDLRQESRNQRREQDALRLCRERVRARNMEAQVARAEYVHGGGKVTFHVSSEQRLDFRDLMRELGQELHVRIDVRQVGARDAAKLVGAIGDCGRELCCSTFLPRFEPVSIRAAKDQNLPLNPAKLAGHCGRLKCCLVYEHSQYVEAKKGLPRHGAPVSTPKGDGRVADVDILRGRIRVALQEGGFETFQVGELRPMGGPPPEPEPEGSLPGVPEG